MSKQLLVFSNSSSFNGVLLPFNLEELLNQWAFIRLCMTQEKPAVYSREEWAYLIKFLDPNNLSGAFSTTFGRRLDGSLPRPAYLYKPRGLLSVWLPNNVSLLGPLVLILLSLTGNRIWMKKGMESEDLVGAFLEFAKKNTHCGPLLNYLTEMVCCETFDRSDPRNLAMAAGASVRIVFGTDAAAKAIHAMPHPLDSLAVSFTDRRSEAWIEMSAVSDHILVDLLKVFAIYGQAGCTSPRRVLLLGASLDDAVGICDRMVELWPRIITRMPAMAVASSNIMSSQWACTQGWQARLTEKNASVMASGKIDLPECAANKVLMIIPASIDQAKASLANNIQTIGSAFSDPNSPHWLDIISATSVKRIVPIAEMHHFGPVWDGLSYWQQSFSIVEMR